MSVKTNPSPVSEKRPAAGRAPKVRRRRGRALLFLLLVAPVAGWFAPTVVAHTPLRGRIVPFLLPGYPAAIETGAAELDWLRPVVLRDVVLHDPTGAEFVRLPEIQSEKTLLDLALSRRQAGKFTLKDPQVRIAVRGDGSNLEDVVRPLLEARSSSSPRGFSIESDGGRLELIDAEGRRRVRLEKMTLGFVRPADESELWQVACTGAVEGPGMPGSYRLKATAGPGENAAGAATAAVKAHVRLDGLVMEDWQPVVSRLWPEARATGVLDVDLECRGEWSEQVKPVLLSGEGRLASREFAVTVGGASSPRNWSLRDLAAGGRMEYAGGTLRLDDVRFKSDLARLTATGAFRLASAEEATPAASPARDGFQVQGDVDLTKLVKTFPDMLQMREGAELTAGALRIDVASKSDGERRTWNGSLEAKGLAAIDRGKSITWDQPLLLRFAAHDSADGPVLDSVDCRSEFLHVSGRGSLNEGTLTASCDLDRLAGELRRFLDLESWRMAGRLQMELGCRRAENDTIGANGRVTIDAFEFALPGRRAWSEKHLEARLTASAALAELRLARLMEASLEVTGGSDRLEIKLLEPVAFAGDVKGAAAPFNVRLVGDLASWRSRSQPVWPLNDWDLRGNVDLTSRVAWSPETVRWEEMTATIDKLHAWKGGLFVTDPRVKIQSSGEWNRNTGRWSAPRSTWASTALSLRADNVVREPSPQGPGTVSGSVVFRGGVEELLGWTRDPSLVTSRRLQGVVSGRVQLERSGQVSNADASLRVEGLALSVPAGQQSAVGWREVWREKELAVTGRGRYDHQLDLLDVPEVKLTSDALQLSLRAAVGEMTTRPSVELAGEIEYDWQNVTPRLRAWLGDDLEITGHQKKSFAFRGPRPVSTARSGSAAAGTELAISTEGTEPPFQTEPPAPGLSGEAALGWQTARLYGLEIGAADLQARLNGATVSFTPIELAVSDGKVHLVPEIQLYREPAALVFAPGKAIDNMRLSPELCRGWMKYVAPLLADATRAEGRLSLDLAGAGIPVADPAKSEMHGTLAIHQAEISPGPTARQLVQLGMQVRQMVQRRMASTPAAPAGAWLTMPEQNVEVQLVDGRVYHRTLEFRVGDVTILTEGSVGLDETLALSAIIPIREEWVQNDRYLANMKGQSIRVGIGGTLQRPQIDPRALNELARQMGGSAAGQLLQEGVRNQLDKLFGRQR